MVLETDIGVNVNTNVFISQVNAFLMTNSTLLFENSGYAPVNKEITEN